MSSGGSGGKQTTTSAPWAASVPYLLGDPAKSIPGIFPEAAKTYTAGQWSPAMQQAQDWYRSLAGDRIEGAQKTADAGKAALEGAYNTEKKDISGVNVERVDPTAARASQGVLNPTNALGSLLSGNVNMAAFDPIAASVVEQVRRNTMEQVMPGIRSEAVAAGQYGGSAQGVAEGLAASRAQQDIATGIAPIYGQAFENAQNRQFATASGLNEQALGNATANANRQLTGDQFNSELEIKKQQLEIQRNAANLAAMMGGSNLYGQGLNFQDIGLGQYQDSLAAPTTYNQNLLNSYAGIINPGAGLGGTSTQKTTGARNPLMQTLGGAASGASLGAMATGMGAGASAGPIGMGIGALLGLVGGLS